MLTGEYDLLEEVYYY